MSKSKQISEDVKQILEDAWLKIVVDNEKIPNIFDLQPKICEENPELFVTYLMSRPEYFYFTCRYLFNIRLLPFQGVILNELWNKSFPMMIMNRGAGKTFLMAVYNWLRLLLLPKRKIVVVGAAFRQSKFVFNYMENIYNNAPLLRDVLQLSKREIFKHEVDRWRIDVNGGQVSFLPVGDGSTIRGERANDIQADEFNSHSKEVFETVIVGFASVRSNPTESVKNQAKIVLAESLGIELEDENHSEFSLPNQIMITGTAGYSFQLMSEYWEKNKKIIEHNGDIGDLVGKDNSKFFDRNGFTIIRLPAELIDFGFMDDAMLARSRATMHSGTYANEFGSVFSKDSVGFFKRSLIESCVPSIKNRIFIDGDEVSFTASVTGSPDVEYVYGIDPAAEVDNFSIVVIGLYGNHRRIVYCWTTNAKDHKEKMRSGVIKETDYNKYCCRKIRNLMKVFPCSRIAIDQEGGGRAIIEALKNRDNMEFGEQLILPVIDFEKPKDTDLIDGRHIIEIIKFASSDWVCEANNGLRLDLEQKTLLFPYFDSSQIGLAGLEDKVNNNVDNLEDCVLEIEELKDELTTIVLTKTPTGRDRWDTPETKLEGGKKGRMKKDRYTSLLMANYSGRKMMSQKKIEIETVPGGFAEYLKVNHRESDYVGPDWFTKKMLGVYS